MRENEFSMNDHRGTETIVRRRYAAATLTPESKLCCPVDYDGEYLKIIPEEVIERDYGCGDPSKYVREGETVLDLGSGTGKICFIAAQIVGPKGKVIGIDMTDEMLEVARRNAPLVAKRTGYANLEFRKGRIQDLALDLERLDQELERRPITNAASFLAADELAQELRVKYPLIASDSIDVVVSNCVLNLVEPKSNRQLFDEIFRVLKKGARAVICDIVSDEEVPDDDNHRMERGRRYSVCDKTYNLYKKAPYREFLEFVDPIVDVPLAEAKPFDCSRSSLRHPKETKGQDYDVTTEANTTCCDEGNCC